MARLIRSTGVKDLSEGHTDAKPGFSSGAVMGSAFGTTTGFLVEARLPLSAPAPTPGTRTRARFRLQPRRRHLRFVRPWGEWVCRTGHAAEAEENQAAAIRQAAEAERSPPAEVEESSR